MAESDAARLARLEERSEGILRDIQRLSREVETFAPIGGQLIELIAELNSLAEDFVEFKDDLKDEQRALRDEQRARAGTSTTVKVALITGSFLLAAALIAAIAQIVSAG